ncbi:hypothetical protein BDV97DRAFT_367720 [Delphinella strobiligena]|nr:hypothetical protein BDV97DRAFT_367720 [Delphinella strobiligena]
MVDTWQTTLHIKEGSTAFVCVLYAMTSVHGHALASKQFCDRSRKLECHAVFLFWISEVQAANGSNTLEARASVPCSRMGAITLVYDPLLESPALLPLRNILATVMSYHLPCALLRSKSVDIDLLIKSSQVSTSTDVSTTLRFNCSSRRDNPCSNFTSSITALSLRLRGSELNSFTMESNMGQAPDTVRMVRVVVHTTGLIGSTTASDNHWTLYLLTLGGVSTQTNMRTDPESDFVNGILDVKARTRELSPSGLCFFDYAQCCHYIT